MTGKDFYVWLDLIPTRGTGQARKVQRTLFQGKYSCGPDRLPPMTETVNMTWVLSFAV